MCTRKTGLVLATKNIYGQISPYLHCLSRWCDFCLFHAVLPSTDAAPRYSSIARNLLNFFPIYWYSNFCGFTVILKDAVQWLNIPMVLLPAPSQIIVQVGLVGGSFTDVIFKFFLAINLSRWCLPPFMLSIFWFWWVRATYSMLN